MSVVSISFEKNKIKHTINTLESGEILAELYTSVDKKFDDEVSDLNEIINDCEEYYNEIQIIDEERENLNKYKELLLNGENIYKEASTIYISGSYKDIFKYLKVNKELFDKKIIIEQVSYSEDDYEAIKKLSKHNVYVRASRDIGDIPIEQYMETYGVLDIFVSKIKKQNLSPIEQLMYTYDIVRDRVYKAEKNNDAKASRNLSSVLTGDDIVCAGYANIFDEIIEKLGFNGRTYTLKCNQDYHARNMVYVKDDKYGINGIYFFDTTWDSKKDDTNDYLNSYRFFARTRKEMNIIYNPSEEDCKYLSPNLLEDYNTKSDTEIIDTVSKLLRMMDGKFPSIMDLISHEEGITKKIETCALLSDNRISLDMFIQILITVRLAEVSVDKKYAMDKENIRKIIGSYKLKEDNENKKTRIKK